MQAVEHSHVLPFFQWRPSHDRQEPGFLRVNARAGAARLAVEADRAALEAGLQSPRRIDARDAVAAGLKVEHHGADDLDALAPIAANADGAAIAREYGASAVAELAKHVGVSRQGLRKLLDRERFVFRTKGGGAARHYELAVKPTLDRFFAAVPTLKKAVSSPTGFVERCNLPFCGFAA